MSAREQFDAVRARWTRAQARRDAVRETYFARYRQFDPPRSWKTRTELAREEAISKAENKALDAMMALLDRISPRSWHSGVPAHWVMESLTFDDAVTAGALSVVPPVAYGSSTRDAERFAAALELAA